MMTATVRRGLNDDKRTWRSSVISTRIDDQLHRLEDGTTARRALSCLLVPEPGDRVLCWVDEDGQRHIVQLLSRAERRSARLDVPGMDELALSAYRLTLHADSQLNLMSLCDLALEAGAGRLSMMSRHLDLNALETLVQNARQFVGTCEHWLQEAKGLARLHGRQTLISAIEDVRADAERISMG
jgi:hypothetical protein